MAMTTQVGLVSLDDSGLVLAHPADDLRGLRVLDPCHHRVGEVDGLIIDEEERQPGSSSWPPAASWASAGRNV